MKTFFKMFNAGVLLNDRCAVGHSFQMMTLTGQETKALQRLMVQGLCLTILLALQQVIVLAIQVNVRDRY